MATINLGRVGFVQKRTYSDVTSYKINDVVVYNNGVYACISPTTGNLPTNTTYWDTWIQSDKVQKVQTTDNCIMRADGTNGDIQASSDYVDDNGNIGLGVVTPASKLHIALHTQGNDTVLSRSGILIQNDNASVGYINARIQFCYHPNNPKGYIEGGVYGVDYLSFGQNTTEQMRIDGGGNILSGADNTQNIGNATHRWSGIYAGSGTINTSDEREKTFYITTEAEKQVAQELKTIIKKFRFNDAIAKKGEDNARLHFGVGAQTVVSVFEKYGLDANKYALLCYDEWDAEYEKVEAEDGDIIETIEVQKTTTVQKTKQEIKIVDGAPVLVETSEEVEEPLYETKQVVAANGTPLVNEDDTPILYQIPVMETVTKKYKNIVKREAGNRYGIRYEELAMFILGA